MHLGAVVPEIDPPDAYTDYKTIELNGCQQLQSEYESTGTDARRMLEGEDRSYTHQRELATINWDKKFSGLKLNTKGAQTKAMAWQQQEVPRDVAMTGRWTRTNLTGSNPQEMLLHESHFYRFSLPPEKFSGALEERTWRVNIGHILFGHFYTDEDKLNYAKYYTAIGVIAHCCTPALLILIYTCSYVPADTALYPYMGSKKDTHGLDDIFKDFSTVEDLRLWLEGTIEQYYIVGAKCEAKPAGVADALVGMKDCTWERVKDQAFNKSPESTSIEGKDLRKFYGAFIVNNHISIRGLEGAGTFTSNVLVSAFPLTT
eukprot:11913-Heterococcus_DN1.PRE.1